MHREECSAQSSESWKCRSTAQASGKGLVPTQRSGGLTQQDKVHFDENSHSTGSPPVTNGLIHSEGQSPRPSHLSKAPSLNTMILAAKLPTHKLLTHSDHMTSKSTPTETRPPPQVTTGLTEQRHSGATKEVVCTTDSCELCDILHVPSALNSILYIVLGYFTLLYGLNEYSIYF